MNIGAECLGLSVGKMMQPIALALSGLLLNHIPAYTLPIEEGSYFYFESGLLK